MIPFCDDTNNTDKNYSLDGANVINSFYMMSNMDKNSLTIVFVLLWVKIPTVCVDALKQRLILSFGSQTSCPPP